MRKCQSLIDYGEIEDPAKMAYSKMALVKRGLRATTASAKIAVGDWSMALCCACTQAIVSLSQEMIGHEV